jgi:hypothetical protein
MKIITTYAEGDAQEMLNEICALIDEVQGFYPYGRVRYSNSKAFQLEIQEVTDEAIAALDLGSDWVIREDNGSWGIKHVDPHWNKNIVKDRLLRSEAVKLALKLNRQEEARAKMLDDAYEPSRFFITELY